MPNFSFITNRGLDSWKSIDFHLLTSVLEDIKKIWKENINHALNLYSETFTINLEIIGRILRSMFA